MDWTPNKVTALRVLVGFSAVALFGHGTWVNLAAVLLTVAAIALDALDGHLARKKQMATPLGAQRVRVRDAEPLDMPSQVDSNSPAWWNEGTLHLLNSTGGGPIDAPTAQKWGLVDAIDP